MTYMLFGMELWTTSALGGPAPTPGEDARRIVRHGLASVTLRGRPLIDPGPKPGEVRHAIVDTNLNRVHVSHDMYYALRRALLPVSPCPEERALFMLPRLEKSAAVDAIWQGRHQSLLRFGAEADVWLGVDAL